jgi:hypothetical protein
MVGAPHNATHGDEQRTHLEERAYQEASGLNKIDYAYLLLLNQNNKKLGLQYKKQRPKQELGAAATAVCPHWPRRRHPVLLSWRRPLRQGSIHATICSCPAAIYPYGAVLAAGTSTA